MSKRKAILKTKTDSYKTAAEKLAFLDGIQYALDVQKEKLKKFIKL